VTLIEAMKWSKETGGSFSRTGSMFCSYVHFTADEILATDWEDVVTFIPKLTGGRWGAAE
jgi:hypothetical protein